MQQWSKDFIEESNDAYQLQYWYFQSAYCYYNFRHHLFTPCAFEICKLKILQEKDFGSPMSLTDVLCDDFSWCKPLSEKRAWVLFRESVNRLHEASINDMLFKIYGGY